jgi:hypothetical protein
VTAAAGDLLDVLQGGGEPGRRTDRHLTGTEQYLLPDLLGRLVRGNGARLPGRAPLRHDRA